MDYKAPDVPVRRTLNDTRGRAIALAASVVLAGALCCLFMPWIYGMMTLLFPTCLLNQLGLRCPLCGATRCVVCLLNMDIPLALYYNPLVVLCIAVAAYLYIRLVISCFAKEYKPFRVSVSSAAMWWMFAGFVAFLIIRNLPFYRAYFY